MQTGVGGGAGEGANKKGKGKSAKGKGKALAAEGGKVILFSASSCAQLAVKWDCHSHSIPGQASQRNAVLSELDLCHGAV